MHGSWVLVFVLYALIASPIQETNGSTGFNKPQIRVTTTFADFDARIMDHWGGGGGKWVQISKDSKHPFQGRTFGGGKREEIRGTRALGSGYAYGASNQSTIAGRPFPFGVWPLYWDQNFMNANEYGPRYDAIRPGGFIAFVSLKTTTEHFNTTENEVYYAIGDRESLLPLMISYVTWCHVTPAWPSRFDPTTANATVKLENVIQYFRGSTFALATPMYNNSFARIPDSGTTESSPLPEFMEYSPFRKCLDGVTENALAIVNKPPIDITSILIIVFTSTWFITLSVGVVVITLTFAFLVGIIVKVRECIFPDPAIERRRLEAARERRRQETIYENYP
ncbi:hypothetical protein FRC19_000629 [Serendipita sp. 401]|nr:hypothetical protein FRC16_006456 [Serendipita sp. 398]KAG8770347.1 hypothetical protein FRC15_004117 [Serendipita sp. 397]KAG8816020.1 hypothetical protein FRC19_000629 [Serendipita sp. 401]KAG8837308.1 hypothetical protein FRC20_006785 [Serendipita sp. 405]